METKPLVALRRPVRVPMVRVGVVRAPVVETEVVPVPQIGRASCRERVCQYV